MGRVRQFRAILGVEELAWSGNLWRSLPAEFLGTALLVAVACGACTPGAEASLTGIALAFGLAVATVVQSIGHSSGGHVNPAVTAGMVVSGHCSLLRAILYILMQCAGSAAGAAVLRAVTPETLMGGLGVTALHPNVSPIQGLAIELIITFVLVFTVCAVCDPNRKDLRGSAPLAVGFSVAACHLWAIKYTGASMNSARSFGPAVLTNTWENHWIYWVGPIIGGVLAGLIYEHLFAEAAPEQEIDFHGMSDKELVPDRTTSI